MNKGPEIRGAEIRGLHHSAYRCRDSEETRAFYEDFLGLPLAKTLPIGTTKTGRQTQALHTFYRLGDGSYLAFFEVPGQVFEFRPQHDFDLHIALEETRGPAEHDFIRSIYFRDPNGYVVELTAKSPDHDRLMDPAENGARAQLDAWQAAKAPVAE